MSEPQVIQKDEMMAPMLVACPSFQEDWALFLKDWVDNPILYEDGGDGSFPYYLVLSSLASHLIVKLETGETNEFAAIFDVVEGWIVRGSHYVSEAAVVGLLEDLTDKTRYINKKVSDFVPWIGPATRKWLPEVIDFWDRFDKGNFRPLSID